MDFFLYEPEDFASDESYLKYYFSENEADMAFWQTWISNHPEKLDCIINADQLISLLALQLNEKELNHEFHRLSSSINNLATPEQAPVAAIGNFNDTDPVDSVNRKFRTRVIQRALLAVVIGTITAGVLFYTLSFKKNALSAQFASIDTKQLLKKVNSGSEPSKFQLEDGSVITLQPGSILNFPAHFLVDKREVMLEGEAFFEVSKNKSRPFYVYCQNMVAHVLGTSFNIKADKISGKVEVAVSFGKVEIYENKAEEDRGPRKKNNGLILTPNQKAIYMEENNQFESSLVDVPLPIPYAAQNQPDSAQMEVIYLTAAPMSEILQSLEKIYGIEIDIENENLNNCHFSGDYSDMNLYGRLDVICQTLGASYEVKGTKILIRGRGCN